MAVAGAGGKRVGSSGGTHVGRAADEGIAGHEGIAYPPGTTLYEGSASQGYGPAGTKARQAKKN